MTLSSFTYSEYCLSHIQKFVKSPNDPIMGVLNVLYIQDGPFQPSVLQIKFTQVGVCVALSCISCVVRIGRSQLAENNRMNG